jgi:hypothetical protein
MPLFPMDALDAAFHVAVEPHQESALRFFVSLCDFVLAGSARPSLSRVCAIMADFPVDGFSRWVYVFPFFVTAALFCPNFRLFKAARAAVVSDGHHVARYTGLHGRHQPASAAPKSQTTETKSIYRYVNQNT